MKDKQDRPQGHGTERNKPNLKIFAETLKNLYSQGVTIGK